MNRLTVIVAAVALACTGMVSAQGGGILDAQVLKGLELRSIGPTLGSGRIQDIESIPRIRACGTSPARSGCGVRQRVSKGSRIRRVSVSSIPR